MLPDLTIGANTVLLRIRVPAERHRIVEEILDKLGMKPSEAVNMLYAQIELQQRVPFAVSLNPPDEPDAAMAAQARSNDAHG